MIPTHRHLVFLCAVCGAQVEVFGDLPDSDLQELSAGRGTDWSRAVAERVSRECNYVQLLEHGTLVTVL